MRKFLALALTSVVAGVALLGAGVNAAFAHTVTVVVDGVPQDVSVVYASVAEVLASQNIRLEARDTVEPALGTKITSDTQIIVRRARPVVLNLDGRSGTYWTTATSVAEVVDELGLADHEVNLSHDPETAIGSDGLLLGIDSAKDVTVTADGVTTALRSPGKVADALKAAGIEYDADDLLTPAATDWLTDGLAITLVRVSQETVTRDVEIPFETTVTDDPTLYEGKTETDQKGANGVRQETYLQTLNDGVVVAETLTASTVTLEPVGQVERRGTKALPVVVNSEVKKTAYSLVLERGWDDAQFNCLDKLWQRESGWNPYASNPYSGAYGIPQALPGSKMASAGADWATNPTTQIIWGLGYIASRYGTPCGAWAQSEAVGWY
ncbi:MAG: G5 domain-containing protein [Propionibacteriaceae bacterium]|nr:G5 domain-containing protein [Propionibacteriaceae bacterium]